MKVIDKWEIHPVNETTPEVIEIIGTWIMTWDAMSTDSPSDAGSIVRRFARKQLPEPKSINEKRRAVLNELMYCTPYRAWRRPQQD